MITLSHKSIAILCLSWLLAGHIKPAQACDSCGAIGAANAVSTALTAWVAANTLATNTMIGMASAGISEGINGAMATQDDAGEFMKVQDLANKMTNLYREVRADNTVNTQSDYCRLATANSLARMSNMMVLTARQKSEQGLWDAIADTPETFGRHQQRFYYKLCKNGQLSRAGIGDKQFTDLQCIDDPLRAEAYLKPSTLLNSPVLVPPSQANMNILDSPASHSAAIVAATWNGLTVLEKKYVSAKRYCENLTIMSVVKDSIVNDALNSTINRARKGAELGQMARLSGEADTCETRLAERVALDSSTLTSGVEQTLLENNSVKIGTWLVGSAGADPRVIYNYTTDANYNSNTPILGGGGRPRIYVSRYLLKMQEKHFYMSMGCSDYASGGATTLNAINCATNAMNMNIAQAEDEADFLDGALASASSSSGGEAEINPLKANYRFLPHSQEERAREASLAVPGLTAQTNMPLQDYIWATEAPAKTAYTPKAAAVSSSLRE